MSQFFDNQYFKTKRYQTATPLDTNTVLVSQELVHSIDLPNIYKTLIHNMRRVAKTNRTVKETKENRKPRIEYCGYSINGNTNNPVQMCSNPKGGLFFNGIANCGGYWRCPVCALKISENKKELLAGLITEHQNRNLSIGFLTLTVRHSRLDRLKRTLDKITKNYRKFQTGRFFAKTDNGLIGQVKTLEITYSEMNGWHPHLHLLFFYNHNDVKAIEKFQKDFISRWFKYADNNGTLSAQNQKIVTSDISDYLAKYDITSEMTKGQIKSSKGLTPFTCLAKIAVGDYEDYQEKRKLYGIYAEYVEYTQGKHFVNISNSIRNEYKEFLQDKEKTDDEIVNEVTIDEVLLKISIPVWKKIAMHDLQPLVLNKWKENGLDAVYNLLTYYKAFKDIEIEYINDVPLIT
ncbi:hypothetical protein SAMN05192550_2804 [Flavobacterium glycines]|uniref:Uncharacterized protein n=1 Tax=Flavobacterium glycines TaxID=551990 RepID=A0A1B9DSR0_9FLAO|nr:protein rep [Flavobacterium glycines]OCB72705.1 hypothetical protein FBGL_05115 [Flavobacterium glycines]GEL11819.1 hypothetical protein FGL01_25580 [Flavobacterium glycines]SDJ80431.1 hypothetical protein SAMN05192550_2804 [Flavobacterium glycines]